MLIRNLWFKKLRDSKKIVSMNNYVEQAVSDEQDDDLEYFKVKKRIG